MNFTADFVFLDSGTGGIPYLMNLLEKFPLAKCVYVGDTANFPYGEKTHEQIVNAVLKCIDKIIKKFSPKVIVLACNTMSVNCLDILREIYTNQIFVGTVPAIKLAAAVSVKRRIGLLATKSTVEHPYNIDLKNHFAADCTLILRGDAKLISFIEHESFTATEQERENACVDAVGFFKENDCDVIILGCTHFLNIKKEMQKICGNCLQVVDSVEGVVNRALNVYGDKDNDRQTLRQKKTFSSLSFLLNPPKLFVTGFNDKKDKKEYNEICSRYNLVFGGIL